ncbi:MAG: hypothetical protein QMC09_07505, partial [Thauera sp.]
MRNAAIAHHGRAAGAPRGSLPGRNESNRPEPAQGPLHMIITGFQSLLDAARQQPEPQRLLLVFTR